MSFDIPTRAEILEAIKADLRLETGVDPLRRSLEYALARALTAQSKGQYAYLAYVLRQCFPDSADETFFWRWARIFGIDQKAATPWQGVVRFTGVDTTVIPALSTIVRSDGVAYETDSAGTIGSAVSGQVDIPCTAASGNEGADGNNDDGQPLTVSPPITDVDPTATVQSTTNAGEDLETAEEALPRLLTRLRTPPSGGGPGDYIAWALEVDGATRAWEFANLEGPNSVSVAFVRDNDGTGAAILPDASERSEVLTYLQSQAPITVDVRVITVTALTVDVTLATLTPNTAAVQAAITAELEDLFAREAAPGATLTVSQIIGAIAGATGEESHTLSLPAADVVADTDEIPILGTVTFP